MSRDPEGLERLKAIGFNGFETDVKDANWDDVRRLGIRPQDAQIRVEPD